VITISEKNASIAWEKSIIELFKYGIEMPENSFFKSSAAVIEIADIENDLYNDLFPISFDLIANISNYLLRGEGNIDHEWTRIYRERLFNSNNDKIETIVELLKNWPDCPRAQISIWNNQEDIKKEKTAPCLQLLWFKIIKNKLVLHVHMRTCDCYGKLLLNFNEFIALQKMVSRKLYLKSGEYIHFIDSLHFHKKDEKEICKLINKIKMEGSLGKRCGGDTQIP